MHTVTFSRHQNQTHKVKISPKNWNENFTISTHSWPFCIRELANMKSQCSFIHSYYISTSTKNIVILMIPFTKQSLKVVGVSKKHACRVETPIKLQQITYTFTLLHKQQYKGQTWMNTDKHKRDNTLDNAQGSNIK